MTEEQSTAIARFLQRGRIKAGINMFIEDWARDGGRDYAVEFAKRMHQAGYLEDFIEHLKYELEVLRKN